MSRVLGDAFSHKVSGKASQSFEVAFEQSLKKDLGKVILGEWQWNSKNKDPELGICLMCLRSNK